MNPPRPLAPYFVLIGVLFVGALIMAVAVEVRMTGEAGVITTGLPESVGMWQGEPQMYCLRKGCGRRFRGEECAGLQACPDCGHEVNNMSRSEYEMLPKDTILNRYAYRHPSGRAIQASVVLSGKQRSSLHRPELCLSVSGFEIETIRKISLDLEDGSQLRIRVLDLLGKVKLPDGRVQPVGSYYAYWFTATEHRTPDHLARMFWMAVDKILFSKIDRWAYISVSGPRELGGTDHLDEVRAFVQEFYPLIESKGPGEGDPAPAQ